MFEAFVVEDNRRVVIGALNANKPFYVSGEVLVRETMYAQTNEPVCATILNCKISVLCVSVHARQICTIYSSKYKHVQICTPILI